MASRRAGQARSRDAPKQVRARTAAAPPVGVGETITGRVEVDTVRPDKPICQLKMGVSDSAGDVCVEETATTYTMPLEGL